MAKNRIPKSKRTTTTTAQPQRRKVEPQPVNSEVYMELADLNTGFDRVLIALRGIGQTPYLHSPSMFNALNLLCRTRAQITRDVLQATADREMENAAYFDRLCMEYEKEMEKLGV